MKKKSKTKPKNNLLQIIEDIKDTNVITPQKNFSAACSLPLGRGWAASFDWHVPVHSVDMFKKLCSISVNSFPYLEGIIIGGDFINHEILGKFDLFDNPPTLREEYDVAKRVLDILCKCFRRVVVMGGNHDYRFNRYMKGQLTIEWVYNALCSANNFTYTSANRIEVGEDLIICHPASSYSRMRAKVPLNIANKFHKNVMSGHTHHGGLVISDNAKHWACEPGAMLDPNKLEYYHRYLDAKPDFVNGFGFVLPNDKGKSFPMMFVDGMVDWDVWEKVVL